MRSIEQHVVLITGSTDEIGKINARKLARMGATVLVHGRNRKKCAPTVKAIRENTGSGSKPRSIPRFASKGTEGPLPTNKARAHVMINGRVQGVFFRA